MSDQKNLGYPFKLRNSRLISDVKVVVSNLEESVTQEDITELFSAVGTIRSVRMVGKGVAEVVFPHRDVAETAIDVYDKRLLDGSRMKLHRLHTKVQS